MKKTLKIAIIGCGRVGIHHARAILKNKKDYELVAICDLDVNRAKKLNSTLRKNYKIYNNYNDMLNSNKEIDIVSIITPSGMHFHHAKDIILNHKKNLIIEKPFVMKVSQGQELIKLSKRFNLTIFPVFQYRYNKSVQRVKKSFNKNEIGKPFLATVRTRWCRTQKYYDRDIWRGTYSHDGGALTNQGIHHIDLLRYINGEVKYVYANKYTHGSNIEVEDTIIATLEFENNSQGIVEITTAARPKDFESSLSFLGTKGTAIIGGWATNELTEFSLSEKDKKNYSEKFDDVYGFGHINLYKEVSEFLFYKAKYNCTADDAIKTINLLHAIYLSSQLKKKLRVSKNMDYKKLGKKNTKINELYI